MAHFYDDAKYWMFYQFVTQHNLYVSLHMTGSSCATERTVTVNSQFSDSKEFNGTGYTAGGYQLVNDVSYNDTANHWAILRSDEIVIPNLSAGTTSIAGVLVYRRVTSWSDSKPAWWVEQTGTPDGSTFRIKWNGAAVAGDMVRLKDAA